MERTLVLIKPDAVERKLEDAILSMYEKNGLQICNKIRLKADISTAEEHYAEHRDKPYFDELIQYITRSELIAVIIQGENAIKKVREINGATSNPDKDTIRGMYAISTTENSVHASDSSFSARRELNIWFPRKK